MKLHESNYEQECCWTQATKNSMKVGSFPLSFMGDVTHCKTPNGLLLNKNPIVGDVGVNLSEDISWSPHIDVMSDNDMYA